MLLKDRYTGTSRIKAGSTVASKDPASTFVNNVVIPYSIPTDTLADIKWKFVSKLFSSLIACLAIKLPPTLDIHAKGEAQAKWFG